MEGIIEDETFMVLGRVGIDEDGSFNSGCPCYPNAPVAGTGCVVSEILSSVVRSSPSLTSKQIIFTTTSFFDLASGASLWWTVQNHRGLSDGGKARYHSGNYGLVSTVELGSTLARKIE